MQTEKEELRPRRPELARYADGVAYVQGEFVPIAEAKISLLDWGFTRSDVTYDVVHVWNSRFFRIGDHLERFERSMKGLHLQIPFSRDQIAQILGRCVVMAGLPKAYVAMICTRGRPRIYGSRNPEDCDNQFLAYAIPWITIFPEKVLSRGVRLFVSSVPRISSRSIDPTLKNYHWGDLTRGVFQAHDGGADTAVLLDGDGFVTEGPGFNVFTVKDGAVCTPDRGVLEGITRRSVMELCGELGIAAKIVPLQKQDLLSADEMFCSTTAGGIMPISQVDDHVMPGGAPGKITNLLRDRYWQKHEEGSWGTAIDYDDLEHQIS